MFHHPLIRAVAYESQLKSDRAQLHRRAAAAIEQRSAGSLDENAALIAEHLQAAGDLHAAFGWHMRAGAWAATRDIVAAWASWERARRVADALPADDADRTAMRIAARAWLCGNAFRVHADISGGLFEELRELCTAAGDKPSLAIGMVGLMLEHMRHGRVREASRLASETMALVESIGKPTLTVELSLAAISTSFRPARWPRCCAGRRPSSSWPTATRPKGTSFSVRRWRWRWHRAAPPGGRWAVRGGATTYDRALAMARGADPMSHAVVIAYAYGFAIAGGVLLADDAALRDIEEALEITERSSEDFALGFARWALGMALVHRDSPAERERGLAVLGQVRDMCLQGRFYQYSLAAVDVYTARERARRGDRDGAIPQMRAAIDDLFRAGQLWYCIAATGVLVETLLERGAGDDVAEAEAAIDRLAAAPDDEGLVTREIWLLRMRALLARAQGDDAAYRDYPGSLPRHGDIAGLRGTYEVGRGDAMTAAAPSGVVTFLFTDIEGSTRRWEADADAMRAALLAHDEVLRTAIEAHDGFLFSHTGDGVVAAFASPMSAVDAAVAAQRALELPVRMGIATGEAELRDGDYFGTVLNRAARVMAAGHGGQILVADSTADLLSGVDLLDLGPRRLRDVPNPVGVFQVRAPGLRTDFPPLRALDPTPGNLRPALTSLIGRESEVAEVEAALQDASVGDA